MKAEPKVYSFDGELKANTTVHGGVWIECALTDPPSWAGRSVDLYVPPELAVAFLKLFRDAGIRARAEHEGTGTAP